MIIVNQITWLYARCVVGESVLITHKTENAFGHEREIPTIPPGNRSYVAEQVIIYLLDARRTLSAALALCGGVKMN